jgi:ribosome-interacting GTPase 1
MMEFENIKIQLVDTPPLAAGATQPWISANAVRAEALLIIIDLSGDTLSQMETVTGELKNLRIRIGKPPAEDEEYDGLNYKKSMIIGNKIDIEGARAEYDALEELLKDDFPVISVSAAKGAGLEDLKLKIFEMLDIIRVYTKTPGQKADTSDPIVLARGSTLEDAATEVHKDFTARLKFARVWGSGKHDGVMVKRDHVLHDGDIIELHM